MSKASEPSKEDDVLKQLLKTPPKPFTPKAKKKQSPKNPETKKGA